MVKQCGKASSLPDWVTCRHIQRKFLIVTKKWVESTSKGGVSFKKKGESTKRQKFRKA